MDNSMFKTLSGEEINKYRQWARDNYKTGSSVNQCWHPVVRAECEQMNVEVVSNTLIGLTDALG